ncbi:MAG: DNA-directed RNA polymerase subunit alpha [Candidatus Doudnabacteria bacterium RIFCSPHIGHO2_02_FULL_48_21]|uniref:DNA-directed RNA polymerase subunit alpha n=1 Tax=Candidatus Doudnabacteria bacterium RIFCSPLOWO2_02_FULL_48_13 TaxID=1817845 RepID=A0A1F5Q984_9BACT|nr:MAG: DNA-directed RNA polymerase subunit alpha [Candidatus Doudnabacteria bacterium RIFCSPHIGHO2_01_48_18]OGE77231.1 MAG: DNA-directed RNA polymerase subunit alpha [Candidatus Doudnabacteria bacterium RIFCSPHIGHO2_01_FULL_48_180]OGE91087.1 MAG: DNA-directed RNA polymerase subunit alpha [Candidatus Doudnabacteria bacterium RIFCSPHIGHO2_12_FULL_47_25]OGE93777.1 MAG: DNA-directed RNA polymerase subunit alpha [Candidatus Doudnabacteria bacterium RIFCSPHIGHO2_02_FULL_48_21]OGE97154.1 MAG: DNA-dir
MLKGNIPLPNKVYWAKDEGAKSVVVIEPLYPGYGVTAGNALRRVLLSSLPGAAVTFVKIKGVDHEFSTINNVTEDVVDIILNLKQLRLRINADEPVRLELKAKGQKEIKAGHIKADSRVEIINPDLVIATLDNKNADMEMELIVEKGLGYVPVEMREAEKREIGMIAVDAIFTPVRNVNFEVQNVRVGQITNYDKLTITMETDGTITGREAMDIAAQILVDHFALLKTSEAPEIKAATEAPVEQTESVPADEAPVAEAAGLESLGLSNRAQNALLRNNIHNVEQLQGMDREGLSRLEGLGEKSIDEILKAIGK